MKPSTSDRELVRLALWDAVAWQESLADAHSEDDPWRKEALNRAGRYRSLLRRRYKDTVSAQDQMLGNAVVVTLDELRDSPDTFGGKKP